MPPTVFELLTNLVLKLLNAELREVPKQVILLILEHDVLDPEHHGRLGDPLPVLLREAFKIVPDLLLA